jgi:HPt (histidine-containing phosphotransfer) domain-containing protein
MSLQFDTKVDEIRNRFVLRTAADAPRLSALMDLLAASDSHPAIDAIQRMGHSLAGAAGTFGFRELAEAADAVESEAAALAISSDMDMHGLRELCKRLLFEIHVLVRRNAGEQVDT